VINSWQAWDVGSLVGYIIQACDFPNNVLQVAKVAGVGSSLKAPKNKGEGDGSETFSGCF